MKPVIKWLGGKRRILTQIKKMFPENYNNYFEPFFGSGALFLDLDLSGKKSFVNDFNAELTNMYQMSISNPEGLFKEMMSLDNTKEEYYEIRAWDREETFLDRSKEQRAARFIYLNKAGFNGMYRTNLKGYFNIPFAAHKKLALPTLEELKELGEKMKETTVYTGDFMNIKNDIKEGDLVYLDPPYIDTFTSYTKEGFPMEKQEELRDLCRYIDSIGAYFIASNSDAPEVYELYKEFTVTEVEVMRSNGGKGAKRGKINETLTTNIK